MKKLTVKEAITQGYTQCGKVDIGWQNFTDISEMEPSDLESGQYRIAGKEESNPSTDAASLLDLISNDIDGRWYDETKSDDSGVYEALAQLDLTELANSINEKLKAVKCWYLTDITLIP